MYFCGVIKNNKVMEDTLTREQLIEIGVNPDNLKHPNGEMNIIVQLFGFEDGVDDDGNPVDHVNPDVYHPRKNSVWSCGCSGDGPSIATKEDKEAFVTHLRDSSERLKIMAYKLTQQANEIEEFGYPKTTLYYPE